MIATTPPFASKKIRNLLIDFGVVLIDLDRTRCLHAFEELGIQGMDALLNSTHQEGFLNEFERGVISPSEFCEKVRSQLKGAQPDISDRKILAAWNSFLVGIPSYKLELLLRLRKDYRLLLLSNTNQVHWQWSCTNVFSYQGHQVQDFFHDIYLSFELHVEKPRKEIFEWVLEDSGILPEETLFIDDSDLNCKVGQAMGFHTYTPVSHEDWNQALQLNLEKPLVV